MGQRINLSNSLKYLRLLDKTDRRTSFSYKIPNISLFFIALSMIATVPVKILNPESTIRYLPVLLYVLGLSTILFWVVTNTGRGVSALLHAKDVFAEQADRRLWAEQALRHRLSEDHTLPELERFGREIASTIKQHEKDGTLIGLMTIVGGAITALGATPPFRTWQTNDTLTLAVSSLILGAGIAAIAKHGFIQY